MSKSNSREVKSKSEPLHMRLYGYVVTCNRKNIPITKKDLIRQFELSSMKELTKVLTDLKRKNQNYHFEVTQILDNTK